MDTTLSATNATAAATSHATEPGARWINGFAQLPPVFYTRLQPTPMPQLALHAHNDSLAHSMGFTEEWLHSEAAAQVLGGNALLPGMDAMATVYSGHNSANGPGSWAMAAPCCSVNWHCPDKTKAWSCNSKALA